MRVFTHPSLSATHVVLDVKECPKVFQMLTELAVGSDHLQFDATLGGFTMTLEVYQCLRKRLASANSLLDLVRTTWRAKATTCPGPCPLRPPARP